MGARWETITPLGLAGGAGGVDEVGEACRWGVVGWGGSVVGWVGSLSGGVVDGEVVCGGGVWGKGGGGGRWW